MHNLRHTSAVQREATIRSKRRRKEKNRSINFFRNALLKRQNLFYFSFFVYIFTCCNRIGGLTLRIPFPARRVRTYSGSGGIWLQEIFLFRKGSLFFLVVCFSDGPTNFWQKSSLASVNRASPCFLYSPQTREDSGKSNLLNGPCKFLVFKFR